MGIGPVTGVGGTGGWEELVGRTPIWLEQSATAGKLPSSLVNAADGMLKYRAVEAAAAGETPLESAQAATTPRAATIRDRTSVLRFLPYPTQPPDLPELAPTGEIPARCRR
jgi:hypothetical protein